ncbi:MAG: hypothetical protein ACREWG_05395, partial [Gammaproteobacteria bacterium]
MPATDLLFITVYAGLRAGWAQVELGLRSRPGEQRQRRQDEQREQGGGDKATDDHDCHRLHDLETRDAPENDNR